MEHFLTFVNKTDTCWLWTGWLRNKSGYGGYTLKDKKYMAHRYAYQLWNGEIQKGLMVRHKCDNRLCVNPQHLILGTNQDNMNDRNERNRQARGSTHASARLNEDDINEIKILRGFGITYRELGERYGISLRHAQSIVANETWKHLTTTYSSSPSQSVCEI